MKKVFFAGAAFALFMFSACSKDDSNITSSNNNNMSSVDSNFVIMASMGNNAEIAQNQLVSTKATNSGVKWFGQFMNQEHSQAQSDLQTLANGSNFRLPPSDSFSSADQAKMAMLSGLTGRAFDSTYIFGAVSDHQNTINLFQNEINNGKNTSVKNYANKYLPHIQLHLHLADSISHTL